MANYALEGEKWGAAPNGTPGGTVTWAATASVPASFVATIAAAFTDWARYGNIAFTQVSAAAGPKITLGFAPLDGLNNQLGVTQFSFSAGSMTTARITFDSDEGWHLSGSAVVSNSGANLFPVALHEIGHAIGLDHYNATLAVMNPRLGASVADLTQSDIDGVQALYGAAPSAVLANNSAAFGTVVRDASGPGGKVFALYDGLLDRAPDAFGLEHFANALAHGMSATDLAGAMLGSGERTALHGAAAPLDNAAFVQQLYGTVLDRPADAGGLATYTAALAAGTSRADLAVTFALSGEHLAKLSGAFAAGIFVPDENAADAARLYYGVLGRAPDQAGLAAGTKALAGGTSVAALAKTALGSSEYLAKSGGLDDAHFVDLLYQNALGRAADPGGLAAYVDALQHGASRADVAVAIVESGEAHAHLGSVIESGWILA